MDKEQNQDNTAAKEIGKTLQRLREAKGMTVEETSEKAGIKTSTLNAIEGGHYNFGIRQAEQVAHALGANIVVVTASERNNDDRRTDV